MFPEEQIAFHNTQRRLIPQEPIIIPVVYGHFLCVDEVSTRAWIEAKYGAVVNQHAPGRPESGRDGWPLCHYHHHPPTMT